MIKKIRKHSYKLFFILILIIGVYSFYEIKSLHQPQEDKIIINETGDNNISFNIKENIENYLIGDLAIKSKKGNLNNLSIYVYDKNFLFKKIHKNLNSIEYDIKIPTLDIHHLKLEKFYNEYSKTYQVRNVKIYCPTENYRFPFGTQYVYLDFKIDNKSVKELSVFNLSKWQRITFLNSNTFFGNFLGVKKEKIGGFIVPGFFISFSYPSLLVVVYVCFFLFLLILLGTIHYKVSSNKKLGIEKMALFIGLIIGLPGIFEAMKMGRVSTLSILNIYSFIIYTWIILIISLIIFQKKKNK
ncbi:hypothetical protein [Tenacibaculum maritimum]|uniref:hypothetical protein n=1 Tax=Tenacibaculum maritimum TaxID=107401 RepID=UPI001E2FDC98|nr:hypothetical protein [Tenacibaculum maritimum]MCD9584771.1 hypothetical protein [Tenacibaculum maritimum]MCD9621615.1 hypothetical protein [Tenacibaculum maritimum]MCD9626818.1 hypothetical protein [Tenacibaculum maritimum]MCD9630484.1 hypothetical protein [Tenacibaculum maritimum]MCD9634303.1 hypothetical protein [Tenacibaculum maritimum]